MSARKHASIVEARKAKGWSQAVLATRAGVSANYVARLERGEVLSPSLATGVALAQALGVRAEEVHAWVSSAVSRHEGHA